MQVFINLKQIGKRRNMIDRQALTLASAPATAGELITAVVCRQVEEYNDRLEQSELLNYLSDEEVRHKAVGVITESGGLAVIETPGIYQ